MESVETDSKSEGLKDCPKRTERNKLHNVALAIVWHWFTYVKLRLHCGILNHASRLESIGVNLMSTSRLGRTKISVCQKAGIRTCSTSKYIKSVETD